VKAGRVEPIDVTLIPVPTQDYQMPKPLHDHPAPKNFIPVQSHDFH
jgi:hypothetical protein